jgi:hypothetical protein
MKPKQWMFAAILAALSALPGVSATLSVSANVTSNSGLFNYAYQFTVGGVGASVDNIFLGSDDISPLKVVLEINGQAAPAWSWLGNDTPQNFLQFFDFGGPALGNGDILSVTLSSALAPSATHFAVGLDNTAGDTTNTVSAVLAPSAAAVPEPGTLRLLGGTMLIFFVRRQGQTAS